MYHSDLVTEYKKRKYEMYPLSSDRLQKLCEAFALPESYVEFLRIMGAGTSAPFWRGQEFFYKDVLKLNEWASEILAENHSFLSLEKNSFAFWMSQGTMFCFFDCDSGDDPPVFLFTEKEPDRFICISKSFSRFIWNYCFEPDIAFEPVLL